MPMHIGQKLRQSRLALGLTEDQVAHRSGLKGVDWYWDIEQHPDEFRTHVPLGVARKICDVLKVDFVSLVGCGPTSGTLQISRSQLVKQQREALGLTALQLGDSIGFEETVINNIEADSGALDALPIEVVITLAKKLHVAPADLVT